MFKRNDDMRESFERLLKKQVILEKKVKVLQDKGLDHSLDDIYIMYYNIYDDVQRLKKEPVKKEPKWYEVWRI